MDNIPLKSKSLWGTYFDRSELFIDLVKKRNNGAPMNWGVKTIVCAICSYNGQNNIGLMNDDVYVNNLEENTKIDITKLSMSHKGCYGAKDPIFRVSLATYDYECQKKLREQWKVQYLHGYTERKINKDSTDSRVVKINLNNITFELEKESEAADLNDYWTSAFQKTPWSDGSENSVTKYEGTDEFHAVYVCDECFLKCNFSNRLKSKFFPICNITKDFIDTLDEIVDKIDYSISEMHVDETNIHSGGSTIFHSWDFKFNSMEDLNYIYHKKYNKFLKHVIMFRYWEEVISVLGWGELKSWLPNYIPDQIKIYIIIWWFASVDEEKCKSILKI